MYMKEGRTPKSWCLWTVVLEKTPVSKRIKTVNLKGNQPWILIGRTYAEAEAPIFWLSDANNWFFGKVPDAGKDWGQKEKRASEDEMAGRHRWWNEHELGQTPGDGDEQGGLECCSPWGHKELDTTWWLNNNTRTMSWNKCSKCKTISIKKSHLTQTGRLGRASQGRWLQLMLKDE